ncbi:glycosyltransferase family 31 protein [Calocera cornea HHB12733]|uniref:Hexosyltransferase n=1 Tax=Calocera cornea HHB12733 TaxID=1353952 RepID=A0A165HJR1_9BASI|nr:glycosyltransferase family 31 protein [Calocera cornea HHB12733]
MAHRSELCFLLQRASPRNAAPSSQQGTGSARSRRRFGTAMHVLLAMRVGDRPCDDHIATRCFPFLFPKTTMPPPRHKKMVLPTLAPSSPLTSARKKRSRLPLILLIVAAVTLILWYGGSVAEWRIAPDRLSAHSPRPHRDPPRYREPWLDTAALTSHRNISQMLVDNPDKWYMFQEPVPELLNAPSPETHECVDDASFGPMLFIGVFTVATEQQQRAVIRALQTLPSPPSEKVVMKFILGKSPDQKLQRRAEAEAKTYKDMIFLNTEENMNDGKTYAFFKWVSKRPVGRRPRFVL